MNFVTLLINTFIYLYIKFLVERKINEKFGVTLKSMDLAKKYFLEDNPNSVTDFQSFEKKMPISGTWDTPLENKIAEVSFAHIVWGANNLKSSYDYLGLPPEEYDEYIKKVFESVKDTRCTYTNLRLIARKAAT